MPEPARGAGIRQKMGLIGAFVSILGFGTLFAFMLAVHRVDLTTAKAALKLDTWVEDGALMHTAVVIKESGQEQGQRQQQQLQQQQQQQQQTQQQQQQQQPPPPSMESQTQLLHPDSLPSVRPLVAQCRGGQPVVKHTPLTRNLTFDSPPGGVEKLKAAIVVEVKDAALVMPSINSFSFRYLPHLVLVDGKGQLLASKSVTFLTTFVAPKWVNTTTIAAIYKEYVSKPAGPVKRTRPCLYNWETGVLHIVEWTQNFLHHDIEFNAETQTFLCLRRAVQRPAVALVDEIFEVDLQGRVLWHWDGNKELPFDAQRWSAAGKHPDSDCVDFSVGYCKDWMHGNTIYWDIPEDVIYYNAKHQDSFFKINKRTKAIEWAVGRVGGFTLYDRYGRPREALFYKAHGVEKLGPDHFLIFDNDYFNTTRPHSPTNTGHSFVDGRKIESRVVEFRVDPVRKEAREVWTWVAPMGRMAHQMGDADRLPNGNTVASFTNTHTVSEATSSGKIVWELRLPRTPMWYVYHFERRMLRPLITFGPAVKEGRLETRSNPTVPLVLFNDVRLRYLAPATVRAFQGSRSVGQLAFNFEPNWRPTPVLLPVAVSEGLLDIELENADGVVGCAQLRLTPIA